MNKVRIVTDSTGYLTEDILEKYQIIIVPLSVTIGEETFKETNLTNKMLFDKLSKISGFSTTSQPPVGAFLATYDQLFAEGTKEIVSIHLSQAISGTLHSAQMARDLCSNKDIHIFDSGSAALGLGLLVWAAAEWAEQGFSAEEIITKLNELKTQTELYFIVNNLENLKRGGRIGGAAALIGTLLQIKPILYLNTKGEIDVFEKVRSTSRAWKRVLEELDNKIIKERKYRICIQHVFDANVGENIMNEIIVRYPGQDVRMFEAGPVIATHVGPSAFGVAIAPIL